MTSRSTSPRALSLIGESSFLISPPTLNELGPRLFPAKNQVICKVSPKPVLYWALPGYVPPPQYDPRNRHGVCRSIQVSKLRDYLINAVRCGYAAAASAQENTKRAVVIQTWKKRRLYDRGNYIQACKALLDALVPDYLVDDSPKWCIDYYALHNSLECGVEVGTLVLVLEILSESTIEAITWRSNGSR
jgi:hypothetical protein